MTKTGLKVGLIQYAIRDNKPRQNINALFKQIRTVLKKAPNLILLPEICIGGTTKKSEGTLYSEVHDECLQQLKLTAKKHHIWFYGSFFEKNNSLFYNTAHLVSPAGKVVASYPKIHLFRHEGEQKVFAAGHTPQIFSTPWGKAGLMICYDLRFPELARELTRRGAKVLLVTAQWPKIRREHWLALLKARAIENQVFVIACNRTGKKRDLVYSGDSVVISPWGETLMHLKQSQVTGICSVDLKQVDAVRKQYPFLQDMVLGK